MESIDQQSENNNNSNNGWTQYQKLVLTELKRHEDKQLLIEKEIVELKLSQARLTIELGNLANSIKSLADTITDSIDEFKKARADFVKQQIDISSLKTKFAIVCSVISMLVSGGIAAMFKFVFKD